MDKVWEEILTLVWPYVDHNFSVGYSRDDFVYLGQLMMISDDEFKAFLDKEVQPNVDYLSALSAQETSLVEMPAIFGGYSVRPMPRSEFSRIYDLLEKILKTYSNHQPVKSYGWSSFSFGLGKCN